LIGPENVMIFTTNYKTDTLLNYYKRYQRGHVYHVLETKFLAYKPNYLNTLYIFLIL